MPWRHDRGLYGIHVGSPTFQAYWSELSLLSFHPISAAYELPLRTQRFHFEDVDFQQWDTLYTTEMALSLDPTEVYKTFHSLSANSTLPRNPSVRNSDYS